MSLKSYKSFCRDALGKVLLVAAARLGKQQSLAFGRREPADPVVLYFCVRESVDTACEWNRVSHSRS